MKKLITIASINFKESPRVRSELSDDAVKEYAAAYDMGDKLPAPLLYQTIKNGLLVADGMHRLTALQSHHTRQTICEVIGGTLEQCFQAAVRENLKHGVRRTNEDKRQSIVTAIALYPEIADLKIAELCHVSHSTVSGVRKMLETSGTINKRETIKTTDGKSRTSKNSNSGQAANSGASVRSIPAADNGAADAAPVVDATGYPIPEKAIPIWERKDTAKRYVEVLQSLRSDLRIAVARKDELFSEVNLNAADCELESLISRLQAAVPYAVCPACQGKLPEKCINCGHRGMVSRAKFERTDPALLKVRSLASSKRLSK